MTLRVRIAALAVAAALFAGLAARADAPLKLGIIWTYSNTDPSIGTFDGGIDTYLRMHGNTVGGRSVTLIKRDDGNPLAPEAAKRLAQELIVQDNVDAVAGFVSTANAIAAGDVTLAARRPQFVANAPSIGYLSKFPNMTRYSFTLYELGAALGKYASAHGIKTAYTIYTNVQAGIDASNGFTEAFTAGGGKILGTDPLPTRTPDYSAYLTRIQDAKPDATFLFLPAFNAGSFLSAYHNAGLDKTSKLLTTGDLVDENNLKSQGDLALGLISAFPYSQAHPSALNARFVKTFKELRPRLEPNFVAVEAYDTMAALSAAVAAQKGDFDYDKVMATLRGLKWESPRGPVQIDPQTRDLVQNIYIRKTERINGRLQNTEIETIPLVRGPG